METFKYIFWATVCLLIGYFICFVPVESNYTINWENEETSQAGITYTSFIPLTKVDTVIQLSKPIYGEILLHEKKDINGVTKYNTVVIVNNKVYKYGNRNAYEYVRQFKDSTNHFKLEEVFWPSHYIRSYTYYMGQEEY
jgi:hypothetical protein